MYQLLRSSWPMLLLINQSLYLSRYSPLPFTNLELYHCSFQMMIPEMWVIISLLFLLSSLLLFMCMCVCCCYCFFLFLSVRFCSSSLNITMAGRSYITTTTTHTCSLVTDGPLHSTSSIIPLSHWEAVWLCS